MMVFYQKVKFEVEEEFNMVHLRSPEEIKKYLKVVKSSQIL